MPSISATNITALLMLQQAQPLEPAANRPGGNDILTATNGLRDSTGFGKHLADAQARINAAMFDVNTISATGMKARLIERAGMQFGIRRDDYDSQRAYGEAIRNAVSQLRAKAGAALAVTAIEKTLGLDKLGISLDTLVNAIIDPNGGDNARLDAALRGQTGEDIVPDEKNEVDKRHGKKSDPKVAAYKA